MSPSKTSYSQRSPQPPLLHWGALCLALYGLSSCGESTTSATQPSVAAGGSGALPPPSKAGDTSAAGSAGSSAAGSSAAGSSAAGQANDTEVDSGSAHEMADAAVADDATLGVEPPGVDCANLPDAPLGIETVTAARGYHGLAFDATGELIMGSFEETLFQARRDEAAGQVFLPGIGYLQGMDSFANGDLVAASWFDSILRITPAGGQMPIASGLGQPYDVKVGPDGRIYTANSKAVYRVDPDTGERTVLLESPAVPPVTAQEEDFGDPTSPLWAPRVLDFSPDHKRLYIGTLSPAGLVYALDLDANFDPVGEAQVFASGVGLAQHDALGVDACGNILVADFLSFTLYRVSPSAEVKPFHKWPVRTQHGHALTWGSGKGGFDATAIYMPQPGNGSAVVELRIGVPARPR